MCLFLDGCDELTERETPLCFLEVALGMMVDYRSWRARGSPPMDIDNSASPAGRRSQWTSITVCCQPGVVVMMVRGCEREKPQDAQTSVRHTAKR